MQASFWDREYTDYEKENLVVSWLCSSDMAHYESQHCHNCAPVYLPPAHHSRHSECYLVTCGQL
eukprot:3607706-Rhodomonas_salina.2